MHIFYDLNNRRVRQFIEQFNAEEAYEAEVGAAVDELEKLLAENVDLAGAIAAFRKLCSKLRTPPPINAVGLPDH